MENILILFFNCCFHLPSLRSANGLDYQMSTLRCTAQCHTKESPRRSETNKITCATIRLRRNSLRAQVQYTVTCQCVHAKFTTSAYNRVSSVCSWGEKRLSKFALHSQRSKCSSKLMIAISKTPLMPWLETMCMFFQCCASPLKIFKLVQMHDDFTSVNVFLPLCDTFTRRWQNAVVSRAFLGFVYFWFCMSVSYNNVPSDKT